MAEGPRNILICSCEDTMPLDTGAIKRGCRGANVLTGRQLCRAELEKFRTAVAAGVAAHGRLHAGGAAVFRAGRRPSDATITYVNVRETAGWSTDAAARRAPRWRR